MPISAPRPAQAHSTNALTAKANELEQRTGGR